MGARFLRTLPPKSKQHIWEHGVKIKLPDGKKQVCDSTQDKDQINRLLCDCVIVYVKYLDRNRAPLSTKKVRPHVEEVAMFIHNKYHPLQREELKMIKCILHKCWKIISNQRDKYLILMSFFFFL